MVGISTMDSTDMTDYVAEMESFQRSDDARQKLLADVLQKYAALTEEHVNLRNDYTSERDIRRNYQKHVDQMQRQLNDTKRDLDSNAFVLALIDGDGVIFQDWLLKAAGNGGSEAASQLQHAIRDHITSIYDNSSNWPVMVQIYVSLDKLATKLTQVGLLRHPQDYRAFAQSFSINQSLFSIIDVGQGKERADHKIKEMLRTFSDNPTCKHIIFGGCHDAGYLLNLDQYKHHTAKAARITLLESTPPVRGFTELPNFQRVRFDGIFKSEPLPEYGQTIYTQPPVSASIQVPIRTLSNPPPFGSPAQAKVEPLASSPSTTTSSVTPTGAEASWATVGKTGVTNGTISIASNTKNQKRKYVYYNVDGLRLDEPLPPRDRTASESIDRRMELAGHNLCNHWHLNKGKCANGSFCKFQHEPKLSPAELNALRYKTRSLACKNKYCENFDCYLGHQCSFERDQGYCPFPDTCNLRHSHGMDKTKVERYDEVGNCVRGDQGNLVLT
ncbi:hypothetical protein BDV95DRAFT_586041 [Massariosphaeria phaeospora]|uniref:C3H1-type domain-containing protein n=1 Tax=Massariosphaeria phaeospora TaxID=100035 RepID=A0A7C8M766_9PLEO|nr:hypothetical protein BDV95DRAFT_586041 [Massariosphaeria phaeospora]